MVKSTQVGKYHIKDYSEQAFEQIRDDWKQLESGKDMTAFQSFEWYRNLCSLNQKEQMRNLVRECRYIVVLQGEQPVMIAPLEIHKVGIGYENYGAPRGVYFIGRRGYTDYLNFVYREFDPEALQTVVEYVGQTYSQTRFFLDRMLESSESYRYLSTRFSGKSIPVNCSALVLPETFEEYRTMLSKNTRQNLRTAANRERKKNLTLTHELISDESSEIKEEILALNALRLKKKNKSSRKEMSFAGKVYCFFAEIYRKLFTANLDVVRESKNTFAFLVKDGQRIVSFFWGIRNDYLHEYYVILAGVDQEYEWFSPNISHLYQFIEEYYQQRNDSIRILDFTRGGEGYKKTIGCTARATCSFSFKK